MQVEPPPAVSEDSSIADLARRRLLKGKRSYLSLPRIPYLTAPRTRSKSQPLEEQTVLSNNTAAEIDLRDPFSDLDTSQAIYKWAVVYENQRGFALAFFVSVQSSVLTSLFPRFTLLSTPYYSHLGLLPHDPPPFTVPEADGRRDKQPQVSLHDYPLPDGTWRWVSTSWMVDMRSEGEVHYDGFEYNWLFRRHKWHPEPGWLSAGGWVRRRRWVRLMMRPAQRHHAATEQSDKSIPSTNSSSTRYSVMPDSSALDLETEKVMVWRGDPDDWNRCHHLMARLNTDGTKLELWREWLGVSPRIRQRKVWSEDDYSVPLEMVNSGSSVRAPALEETQRESLATVVHDHVWANIPCSV